MSALSDRVRGLEPPAHSGSVTRDQLTAAVRSLGLEPEQVRSINLTPHEIEVETWLYDFSFDPPARRFNEAGDNYVRHHMAIPVVDD